MTAVVKVYSDSFQLVVIWRRNVLSLGNAEMRWSDATTNSDICPVLKHGPRSLTHVRVYGLKIHVRNESDHSECASGTCSCGRP